MALRTIDGSVTIERASVVEMEYKADGIELTVVAYPNRYDSISISGIASSVRWTLDETPGHLSIISAQPYQSEQTYQMLGHDPVTIPVGPTTYTFRFLYTPDYEGMNALGNPVNKIVQTEPPKKEKCFLKKFYIDLDCV